MIKLFGMPPIRAIFSLYRRQHFRLLYWIVRNVEVWHFGDVERGFLGCVWVVRIDCAVSIIARISGWVCIVVNASANGGMN